MPPGTIWRWSGRQLQRIVSDDACRGAPRVVCVYRPGADGEYDRGRSWADGWVSVSPPARQIALSRCWSAIRVIAVIPRLMLRVAFAVVRPEAMIQVCRPPAEWPPWRVPRPP